MQWLSHIKIFHCGTDLTEINLHTHSVAQAPVLINSPKIQHGKYQAANFRACLVDVMCVIIKIRPL